MTYTKPPDFSLKHGTGSEIMWAYFAASGPEYFTIIDTTMDTELYKQELNMKPVTAGKGSHTSARLDSFPTINK